MTEQLPAEMEKPDLTMSTSVPWLVSLRNAMFKIGNEWMLPADRALTAHQRTALRNRVNALQSHLSCDGSRNKAVAVELAKLFAAFPSQSQSEAPAELRMEAYFDALDGIPAWAISHAVSAVVRGDAGFDKRFAPTPPQLASLAREGTKRIADDIAMLRLIERARVDVPEPSEAERARVAQRMDELKQTLRPEPSSTSPERAFRDMCVRAGVDPDTIPDAPERKGFQRLNGAVA